MSMSALTMHDWLERARAADGDERATSLREAESLAEDDSDWRALAQVYRTLASDRDAARRCLVRATEIDPQQVWCFGDLAKLLHEDYADTDGALAVLGQAEVNLADDDSCPGYCWRQLAELYHELGADIGAIRRPLDSGRERARAVDDYCSMAVGYSQLLGEEEFARELLHEAEKKLANAETDDDSGAPIVFGYWTIANSYKNGLDDAPGARQCIERGLAQAEDVAGCTLMAAAWTSHATGDETLTQACLRKGEELADSPEHWLELAEAHHEHLRHQGGVRRCLERALADADDEQRRRIAHGYRHWLDDAAAADDISPRGVEPAKVADRQWQMDGWHADAGALLGWLRARVTDEMLDSIASADYGTGRAENLLILGDIRETGLVPVPLVWSVHEVSALCRWGDGERVEHVERALACTLLCLDYAHGQGHAESIESTVPALVESCLELGGEATRALVGFLVWLIETEDPDDETDGLLAALYGLVLAQASLHPDDERLVALARATVELERDLFGDGAYADPERGWLNRVLRGLRDDKWRQLTARLLGARAVRERELAHLHEIRSLMLPE